MSGRMIVGGIGKSQTTHSYDGPGFTGGKVAWKTKEQFTILHCSLHR
jgi:hypothetical protein